MDQLLERVADARAVVRMLREQMVKLEADLANTPAGKRLMELQAEILPAAQAEVKAAEDAAREAALDVYQATDNKRVHPDILIRVYKVPDYDNYEAIEWAAKHARKVLKLDKRAFEKVAKAMEPWFVEWKEEPRATISRDLSHFEATGPRVGDGHATW